MDISDKKSIIKNIKERIELFKHYSEYEERDTLEIKNNLEYITWIEHFTEQSPLFGENYVTNLKYKELLDTDKINMKKIRLLYNIVSKYASSNYIYLKRNDNYGYYLIRYNNIVYEIGISSRLNGYSYYVKRLGDYMDNDIMEFKDIMEDKISNRKKMIDTKLIKLDNILEEYSNDIPIQAIEDNVKYNLEKIKRKR